jgi:plasmid stabilization system protein ParE
MLSLFFERIYEALEYIKKFPQIGPNVLESKNPNDKELINQKYRLIYRFLEKENKILIMMIIHGSRLLKY